MLQTNSAAPFLTIHASSTNSLTAAVKTAKFCSLDSPSLREQIHACLLQSRHERLFMDANMRTNAPRYERAIQGMDDVDESYSKALWNDDEYDEIDVPNHPRLRGKVLDWYVGSTTLALVATDRQSVLYDQKEAVPYKGAVLILMSAWWLEQTQHIIKNHWISTPHPNVMIVKKCEPFPIAFGVR
jgi:hypothetical protein